MTDGWPWNSNSKGFLFSTCVCMVALGIDAYPLAAGMALCSVMWCASQICDVIKARNAASQP